MRRFAVGVACLASVVLAGGASASVTVYDFDNYATSQAGVVPDGFTAFGTYDVIRSGDFGVTCAGGAGACLTSRGNFGVLESIASFAAAAGDPVRLTFDISGSQRTSGVGRIVGRLIGVGVNGDVLLNDLTVKLGGTQLFYSPSHPSSFADAVLIPSEVPFTPAEITFRPAEDFTFRFQIATSTFSGVDAAPILDNLRVSINEAAAPSAVPEAGTWATMIAGFGVAGVALRRRRASATSVARA